MRLTRQCTDKAPLWEKAQQWASETYLIIAGMDEHKLHRATTTKRRVEWTAEEGSFRMTW